MVEELRKSDLLVRPVRAIVVDVSPENRSSRSNCRRSKICFLRVLLYEKQN